MVQVRGLVESLGSASLSAADGGLVRSVLACGFYPLVGRLLPVKGNQGGPRSKATIITAKDEKVSVLPHAAQCCISVCCAVPCCAVPCCAVPCYSMFALPSLMLGLLALCCPHAEFKPDTPCLESCQTDRHLVLADNDCYGSPTSPAAQTMSNHYAKSTGFNLIVVACMQVRIHPSSINSQLSVPDSSSADSQDCPIILFEEITRGEAQLYVRQCTLASPHALLLVAAHLALSQEQIQLDDSTGLPFVHLHEHCALAVLLAADCVYIATCYIALRASVGKDRGA